MNGISKVFSIKGTLHPYHLDAERKVPVHAACTCVDQRQTCLKWRLLSLDAVMLVLKHSSIAAASDKLASDRLVATVHRMLPRHPQSA